MFIMASLLKEALMKQSPEPGHLPRDTSFTEKQGQGQSQYLAFICAYTRINKTAPAEADRRRHFQVTPPSVHQMVLNLERAGLIKRVPGKPRSIQILVQPENLPVLR